YLHTSFQDTMHIGEGNAIIGDRLTLIFRAFHPVSDLSLDEHVAAAVLVQVIRRQIFRKTLLGARLYPEIFSGMFMKPRRNLHRSDILALPVMSAPFHDEDRIPVF